MSTCIDQQPWPDGSAYGGVGKGPVAEGFNEWNSDQNSAWDGPMSDAMGDMIHRSYKNHRKAKWMKIDCVRRRK